MSIVSYRKLIVWQRSIELVVAIYELTKRFPMNEQFGLTAHIRKTSISIPSNIAEGKYRWTAKEYGRFLRIAYASGAELETQIIISKRTMSLPHDAYQKVDQLLDEVMRMLNSMLTRLYVG
ncbi:MAG: four helix bundle protein [Patescibacteria group bacterium]|jgi:four helix bundle protein